MIANDSDAAYRHLRRELREAVSGYGMFKSGEVRWCDRDLLNAARDAVANAYRVNLLTLAVRWLEKDNAEMKRALAESRQSVNA